MNQIDDDTNSDDYQDLNGNLKPGLLSSHSEPTPLLTCLHADSSLLSAPGSRSLAPLCWTPPSDHLPWASSLETCITRA